MRTTIAMYDGTCPACGEEITAGIDDISFSDDKSAFVHAGCNEDGLSVPLPPVNTKKFNPTKLKKLAQQSTLPLDDPWNPASEPGF